MIVILTYGCGHKNKAQLIVSVTIIFSCDKVVFLCVSFKVTMICFFSCRVYFLVKLPCNVLNRITLHVFLKHFQYTDERLCKNAVC